jgi:hypothetical protein
MNLPEIRPIRRYITTPPQRLAASGTYGIPVLLAADPVARGIQGVGIFHDIGAIDMPSGNTDPQGTVVIRHLIIKMAGRTGGGNRTVYTPSPVIVGIASTPYLPRLPRRVRLDAGGNPALSIQVVLLVDLMRMALVGQENDDAVINRPCRMAPAFTGLFFQVEYPFIDTAVAVFDTVLQIRCPCIIMEDGPDKPALTIKVSNLMQKGLVHPAVAFNKGTDNSTGKPKRAWLVPEKIYRVKGCRWIPGHQRAPRRFEADFG